MPRWRRLGVVAAGRRERVVPAHDLVRCRLTTSNVLPDRVTIGANRLCSSPVNGFVIFPVLASPSGLSDQTPSKDALPVVVAVTVCVVSRDTCLNLPSVGRRASRLIR